MWKDNVNYYFQRRQSINVMLGWISDSEEQAQEWLDTYHFHLGGAPKDLIKTEEGFDRVRNYLSLLDKGYLGLS